jgi:hypothetical protein
MRGRAVDLPEFGELRMFSDLILAIVFLAMIVGPALLAMRAGKQEKDASDAD